MIETSTDIFWITLSASIALLTLFSCWGIFYIVQIIRRAFKAIKGVEEIIESFNELIKTTKQKVEHSAAYVSVIADGVKKAIELAKSQSSDGTEKSGGSKSKKGRSKK